MLFFSGGLEADALPEYFLAVKYGFVVLFCLWAGIVYLRPRPLLLMAGTAALSAMSWAAFEIPLRRPYAFGPPFDRMFNVAMGATAATGRSLFESYQVGATDLEPFWRGCLRLISGGRPENVLALYPYLSLLVLLALPIALYWGLPRDGASPEARESRRWELALAVYVVLLLSSSPSEQLGVFGPFWSMNFFLKPNHVLGFVLLPLWVRAFTSELRWVRSVLAGALLGLLGWVFLMHWAYVLVGLACYPLVARLRGRPMELGRVTAVGGLSFVLVLPYVAVLVRSFHWGHGGAVAAKVWLQTGYEEGYLNVLSFGYEHGPLFLLSLVGIVAMVLRRARGDLVWVALIAGAIVGWAGYLVSFALEKIIEPEEFYFYCRFLLSVAAGTGALVLLRALGASWESSRGTSPVGRLTFCGFLLLTLPGAFPYWWNPIVMDRYYEIALEPLPEDKVELAAWIRANTPKDAVFVAGPETSLWIAALSGRRVLTTGDHRPYVDHEERKALEERMIRSRDRAAFEEAVRRYQITHLALDADLLARYGMDAARLAALPWLEPVHQTETVTVVSVEEGLLHDATDPPRSEVRIH